MQMVDYPLFRFVGKSLGSYEKERLKRVLSLGYLMLSIESITALILLFTPQFIPTTFALINLILMIPIWIVTSKVEIPLHIKLSKGYKEKNEAKLLK